jgi:DNA primase large subunit
MTTFLQQNNLRYESLDAREFQQFRSQLEETLRSVSNDQLRETLEGSHFFKVPFQTVLDLVRQRKVFLNKGFAYVHKSDLLTLVLAEYR